MNRRGRGVGGHCGSREAAGWAARSVGAGKREEGESAMFWRWMAREMNEAEMMGEEGVGGRAGKAVDGC